jgi:hypothetical protein
MGEDSAQILPSRLDRSMQEPTLKTGKITPGESMRARIA